MSKKDDIISYVKNHPNCTTFECAEAVNSTTNYIRKIFRKIGYKAPIIRIDKRKYEEGDYIGRGVLLKKRLDKDNAIFICPYDGKEFVARINNVASGKTISCGCQRYKTFEEKPNFIDLTGQRFGKLTALYYLPYRNNDNRIIWHCLCNCGREKNVVGKYLRNGDTTSCGCICSKGESAIEAFLRKNNIEYVHQKIFDDCINSKTNTKLKFDFYLSQYNACIEYDGEQHFYATGGYITEESVLLTQERDSIKNQYCLEHGISLYRISYLEYNNIEERMKEILERLGS